MEKKYDTKKIMICPCKRHFIKHHMSKPTFLNKSSNPLLKGTFKCHLATDLLQLPDSINISK